MRALPLMLEFDFHARHVDAGRTLAAASLAADAERKRLAYLIAEAWMHMIFRHGFFHADPHPSNIMVLEQTEHIGLIDFGMVGKLTDEDMSKLTGLFIDVVNERIEALPRRLAALGVRYPKYREEEFVNETRAMLDYVTQLTEDATRITPKDHERLRAVGFDDRGILQITLIASWFNYINRVADALGVGRE